MRHRQSSLDEITLTCGDLTLVGYSRAGLATYLHVPELDCLFDAGECPPSASARNHVFLTHGHGDHSRCLLRHLSLRALFGIEKQPTYYMPAELVGAFRELMRADAAFGGIREDEIATPDIVGLEAGTHLSRLAHRPDLAISTFEADHRSPSLGYTVLKHKTRLRPVLAGTPGPELARLRAKGVEVDEPVLDPLVTFIGDHRVSTLREHPAIWASRIVVVEATFIMDDQLDLAHRRGHTHLAELATLLRESGADVAAEHIVLKHFSLRYSNEEIRERVFTLIPSEFHDRIRLLI